MKNFFGIHPTVIIGNSVELGQNVSIGPRSIVYDNVSIGANTRIGSDVVLGEPTSDIYTHGESYTNPPLRIGADSIIRSGSILYAGSVFGPKLETGHRVTIRENTTAGTNFRVGTLCDIQGHCRIGNFVRFHSNVHIGQKSTIGDFVWIFPYVVLTNDPHPPSNLTVGVEVHDFAVIATMSVILPGVKIGRDALVGAGSIVTRDVVDETVVAGNPAKAFGSIREIRSKTDGAPVYPWREHFERGMPWEGIGYDKWKGDSDE